MNFRPRFCSLLVLVLTVGASPIVSGKPWWARGGDSNDGDFLPPDVAFQPSVRIDGAVLRIRWAIADGYYLYRHKFEVQAESPDLSVSAPSFPPGVAKTDPYLGTQEVYYQQVEGTVAYTRFDAGAHPLQIKVTYQGCAEAGLCYLPISKVIFPAASVPAAGGLAAGGPAAASRGYRHPWVFWAIGGGALAFLLSGLMLRKGRRLDTPAL